MSTKRETTPVAEKKTTVKKAPTERKTSAAPRKSKAAVEMTPSAEAKVAKPTASAPPKVTAERPVVATPAVATPAVAVPAVEVPVVAKPVVEKPAVPMTRVMAFIDVGPGNALFLRGEGAGLSWEAGVPMNWTGAGCWSWSAETAGQEVTFKVLINDQHWAWGDNLKVSSGDTTSFTPAF